MADLALPVPGSQDFVPSLLQYIGSQLQDGWGPDPTLFSIVLLSMIVHQGGLMVNIRKDDSDRKHGVRSVASHLAAITCGVFGLMTHHAHLGVETSPDSVPSHFLSTGSSSSFSVTHSHSLSLGSHSHPGSRSLSTTASRKSSRRPLASTSRDPLNSAHRSNTHTPPVSASSSRFVSAKSSFDPLRATSNQPSPRKPDYLSQKPSTDLPKLNSQRPLVESPDEMPHSGLWVGDHRVPQALIVTGLEKCTSPIWIKLVDILLQRKIRVKNPDNIGGEEMLDLELPDDFMLIWVRDEDAPVDMPSYLADQFVASTSIYPSDILTPPSHIPLTHIIPSTYIDDLRALLPYTHIHPPLQDHIANLLSALSAHPRLKATVTNRVFLAYPMFVQAHRLLASPFNLPEGWRERLNFIHEAIEEHARNDHLPAPPRRPTRVSDLPAASNRIQCDAGNARFWGKKAGEEPDIRDLRQNRDDEEDGERWFATPENVNGVWELCLRHRVRARGEMDQVMWQLKHSALSGAQLIRDQKKAMRGSRGAEERILRDLIATV